MITRLAVFSVDRRVLVVVLTLLCAAAALVPALRLPLDALPDLTNNQVIVLTRAPGLSPEEVELTVTRPLEVALSGVSGLVEQRSLSRYGISAVTAVFDDDLDAFRARQIVAERAAIVELPEGVEAPELAPLTGGLGEIFHVTLSSDQRTRAELLELSNLRVSPLLKSVPGVVEVNPWGGAVRTLDVVANPALMAARSVTLGQVRTALQAAHGAAPGGALDVGSGQALVRAQARPKRQSDLAAAIVAEPFVRASDIAQIKDGELLRLGAATLNGNGETVYLMAQMLRDQNALEVIERIHARLPEVLSALPKDVHLDIVYDRSELVGGTLRTVAMNLAEGGGLVIFVLLAFLGSVRAGLIAASVIPLSMVFATAVMSLFGMPGNLMSLGALDFGLLVDGAIVLVEGVFHAPPSEHDQSWTDHVREIAARAARPVFFSVLVILLVYVPVLSLVGTDGKLFRPMALTVVLALFASLILSMTWVPAMLALVLKTEHIPVRPPLVVRIVDAIYPAVIERLIVRRVLVASGAVLLLAVGIFAASTLGVEFTPQLNEGDLVIQTTRAPETSLDGSVKEALKLERVLRAEFPEIQQIVSRVGSPAVATDIMGLEQADVFVGLAPQNTWRRGMTTEQLVSEMQRVIEEKAPGGDPSFTQPIQMRFNELLGGAVTDVAASLYGDDLNELQRLAHGLANAFERVKGAEDVKIFSPPDVPIITVRPRPLDAAQVGLSAQEVLESVQAIRVGLSVGQTWDGALRIPLRLLLDASPNASELERLPITVRGGALVPLSRVADVERGQGPGLVNRRNGQRRLVIGFNVRGADLGTVVGQAQRLASERVALPRGYRLEWGGQYESLQEASRRLLFVVPVALLLIIFVLALTFRSLRAALSVFLVVPIAAVGGLITLAVREMPVSLPAAIGFIALSGIAVMNGVVWMARALELEGISNDPIEIARGAALERARPVLMTALVAALGFVPMMLSTGVGAEVQRPLATVVVGGLITSTLLTLIVLPVLYPWLRSKDGSPTG